MEYQFIEDYFDEEDIEIEEKRKYLVVVIYDIVDNKRRAKLVKFLKGFGGRVQKSAFECILDKTCYSKLVREAGRYVGEDDLLRIYKLFGSADVHIWGAVRETVDEDVIII